MKKKARTARCSEKIVTAMMFLTAVLLIGGSISGSAKARRPQDGLKKYYASIAVEPGDTLWGIASEYMTPEYGGTEEYIREVRELNHLNGNDISAGKYLMVPYYSDAPCAIGKMPK